MKQLHVLFLLMLLFVGHDVLAQSFTTRVSSSVIGKKDVVQVEYIAENLELQELVLPVFKGWSILSGPNFSSNRLQTGNIVKQQVIYTLTLEPQATGKLIIPGARATIENKIRLSNTIAVEVKKEAHIQGNPQSGTGVTPPPLRGDFGEEPVDDDQVLKKGENAKDKIKNNLLVKVEASKKTAYVGEPVLVTYKLCTRIRSQSRVVKQPAFSGSTVLEMTSDEALPTKEIIGGKRYNVYIIRQVQLIPLQAGVLELPSASVENAVTFYREGQVNYRDLFYNNPTGKQEDLTVTLKNQPLQLTINPLPTPAPPDFAGPIGKFTIDVRNIEGEGNSSNGNMLSVVVSGRGNLQLTKTPEVAWPQGLEGFEATEQEQINKAVYPAEVSKTFTYPFVAAKSGNYTIPSLRITYFDPEKNTYQVMASQPVRLNVVKTGKVLVRNDGQNYTSAFYSRLYLILGVGLLAILFGLIWYNKSHKPLQKTQPIAPPLPKVVAVQQQDTDQYVYQIRQLEPGVEGALFYRQLHQSITAWLQARYHIPPTDIDAFSNEHPARAMALQQLSSVLKECSLGMYTPMYDIEAALGHRQLALDAINALEKQG